MGGAGRRAVNVEAGAFMGARVIIGGGGGETGVLPCHGLRVGFRVVRRQTDHNRICRRLRLATECLRLATECLMPHHACHCLRLPHQPGACHVSLAARATRRSERHVRTGGKAGGGQGRAGQATSRLSHHVRQGRPGYWLLALLLALLLLLCRAPGGVGVGPKTSVG